MKKLCPFMSQVDRKILCQEKECMAWGKWEENGAYRNEIKREGCILLKKSFATKSV